MKKKILSLIFLMILCQSTFAVIMAPSFRYGNLDESAYTITVDDNIKMIRVKKSRSQTYHYALRAKNRSYEIRYILFSQTKDFLDNEVALQVGMVFTPVLLNIAGGSDGISDSVTFDTEDVNKDFNADYGLSFFIKDCRTDFRGKWHYLLVNVYYKKGVGIVFQTIHFNYLDTLASDEFDTGFYSFRFN